MASDPAAALEARVANGHGHYYDERTMLQHVPFILHNASRNRRRSILTIASMSVSLCLLGMLLAVYQTLYVAPPPTSPAARRLIMRHRVSLAQVMPIAYRQQIEKVPGVLAVTPWQWFGGMYKSGRDARDQFARYAVDPKAFLAVRPELILDQAQKDAFVRERTGCITDKRLAARQGWKLGERITLVGDIFPVTLELKLVGIYEDPLVPQPVICFQYDYLKEAVAAHWDFNTAGTFGILTDSAENAARIAHDIDAKFDNSPAPTKTETEQAFVASMLSFLGNVRVAVGAVSAAVTFTLLLVSANTVAMAVRERVRETALLRTLGFTPAGILGLILGEAATLGGIGGAAGMLMAMGLCSSLCRRGVPAALEWRQAIVVVVMGMLVGLASAAGPAWLASRRSVVQSLRYSG